MYICYIDESGCTGELPDINSAIQPVFVLAGVFIKNIGQPFVGTSVYSSCIQQICRDFNNFLVHKNSKGIVIADSRNKPKNANVSHSVFTQINSPASHQEYSKILEVPVFGHSDNHAGLQLADTLCSALLFPIATNRCCLNHMKNTTHCHEQHSTLISRYGSELQKLQYRYSKIEGNKTYWYGGISLSDPINRHNASVFFK